METEWLEVLVHESERPVRISDGVAVEHPRRRRAGVRACVVAWKCRNGHGAKARRKAAAGDARHGTNTGETAARL